MTRNVTESVAGLQKRGDAAKPAPPPDRTGCSLCREAGNRCPSLSSALRWYPAFLTTDTATSRL